MAKPDLKYLIIFIPNLTGEYVSRIEKKAVEKLRKGMECLG